MNNNISTEHHQHDEDTSTSTELAPISTHNHGGRTQDSPAFPLIVADFLSRYQSLQTVQGYRRDIGKLLAFLDAHSMDLADLSPAGARIFLESLTNARTGQPVSEATSNRTASTLSAFYRYLLASGVLHNVASPFAIVSRHRVSESSTTTATLTSRQLDAMIQQAREHSPRAFALLSLMLTTGLRVSECISLNVEDFSWDYDENGERVRVVAVKVKGGRRRRVAVPLPAWDAIAAYRASLGHVVTGDEVAHTGTAATRTPVFVVEKGKRKGERLDRTAASHLIEAVAERVKARTEVQMPERVTAHVIRHAVATIALRRGRSITEVQGLLGHADIRTTQRYVHVGDELRTGIGNMMAEHL